MVANDFRLPRLALECESPTCLFHAQSIIAVDFDFELTGILLLIFYYVLLNMNKKRPDQIRTIYSEEADSLIAFYRDAAAGFSGGAHEKRNLTTLSELVFLNAYVAFETFLSDLFMAYINKKSINYQNERETKIKKVIKEEFGDWYSNRVSLSKVQHLKAEEVENLLDPRGFNITFSSSEQIKRLAGGWLSQEFRKNVFTLAQDDFEFIDCCREIRNAIAHKSKRALDSMNSMLRDVPNPSSIQFIHRAANDIKVVGVFLKSRNNGQERVIACISRLKDISLRM